MPLFDRLRGELAPALADAVAGRGRIILIEGAAGLGKSALLAELAEQARAQRFTVASVRARQTDRRVPGPALRAALSGRDGQRPSRLPDTDDELLDCVGPLEPLAVLIDDAQLASRSSLELLAGWAGRICSRPMLLALAFRPSQLDEAARGSIAELSAGARSSSLTLRPLAREDSDELVRSVLPDATPACCAECAELTGGNPSLLSELAVWIAASGLEPVSGTPAAALEPVPPRALRRFVAEELRHLGQEALGIASALALTELPLTLSDAARVAGIEREPALRALEALLESGVVRAGEPLRFAQPVAAFCLRADTPPTLAAELRRRAAELASEQGLAPEVSARHLLLAPPTGDPLVVEKLVQLADEEVEQGKPRNAQTLIDRALAENIGDPSEKSRLLVRLGRVNLLQGRVESATALAAGAAGLQRSRDRAGALVELGVAQLAAGSPRDASLAFDAAREIVADDDPLRSHAEARSAFAALLDPDTHVEAATRIERLSAAADAARGPSRAELLLATACRRLCRAEPRAETVSIVAQAMAVSRREDSIVAGYFDMLAAAVLIWADEFHMAERSCEAAAAAARKTGSVLGERNIELAHALALLRQGALAEAASRSRAVLEAGGESAPLGRATAASILASAQHEEGELERASATLAAAPQPAPRGFPHLLLLEARARVCLERGRLADALDAVHETEQVAAALQIANPAVLEWQPIAAVCYARVGDKRRARELADDAVELAERFGAPRARALTLRTRAHLQPRSALSDLELARELIESSESALERAKVLVEHGSALHRCARDRAARACLRKGLDLADRLGAERVRRVAHAALLAAGGRPRRARITGPEALTPAERRVVELALAGAGNREIAAALVVTQKTVEWHLSKAFVKLNVNSREQLGEVMQRENADRPGVGR